MKKYKLIAFDVDGTILNEQHQVCPELKNTVAKLQQQGYLFTLATARMPISALRIATELGLDHQNVIITLNGGLITNQQKEIIHTNKFDSQILHHNLNQLPKEISRNYYVDFEWFVEHKTSYTQQESSYSDVIYQEIHNNKALSEVNKITLIADNNLLQQAKILLNNQESLFVGFSHPNHLEILNKNISKYSALVQYANLNNISTDAIIAFGDGENDIPMLQHVGLGVAMGNADEHVKSVAKDVTLRNDEAGVHKYLEKLIKAGVL